ncbi:MAG: rod shape-determining protein MreC [Acetobacteraceae bacterium]|nr:rod shape-determining protein MreC [Acetobacteraceae bacterium]
MIRLSVPFRQALARLALPVLIAASFGLMLIGKADTVLIERARAQLADLVVPLYAVLARPIGTVREVIAEVRGLIELRSENVRLREENERLRRWYDRALALEAENLALRRVLNAPVEPTPIFTTARVVADVGGAYARSALLVLEPNHTVRKGQVAVDAAGLVGRVSEVGHRSARLLLLTDINSRIPVQVERTGTRAILAGTNAPRPRIQHWTGPEQPQPGDRIVTSSEAGAVPAGLPVGIVREGRTGLEVEPFADLDRLTFVRLHEFGLGGILPPDQVVRPTARARRTGG